MNGSNLLDNLDEKVAAKKTQDAPMANTSSTASTDLNIPIEDTPDVDVSTQVPEADIPVPSKAPIPPVTPESGVNTAKMDFLKARDKGENDLIEAKKLPFGIDIIRAKSFALNFIVPIVSFGVSLILILTIIVPSWSKLPELKVELSTKQNLQNTLNRKLSDLERLLDFRSIVDEDSTLIDNVLVSEEMVPELLSEVDHIAKQASLEVTRLSYSLSQAGSGSLGYPAVDISLGVLGTYDQLTNFLRLTENAARLVDVSTYRYSIGTQDVNLLSINLVLRSPYLYVNSSAVTDDPIDLDITSSDFIDFIAKLKSLEYYNPNEIPVIETIVETAQEEQNLPSE